MVGIAASGILNNIPLIAPSRLKFGGFSSIINQSAAVFQIKN